MKAIAEMVGYDTLITSEEIDEIISPAVAEVETENDAVQTQETEKTKSPRSRRI